MKIRQMTKDAAWELHDKLQSEAQMKFIYWVMEEEEVDFEMASAICTGRTDPPEPEYTLGYKLADPLGQVAMNMQISKKKRQQATENFMKELNEAETKLFLEEVAPMDTRSMFKAALKKEKRKQKVRDGS